MASRPILSARELEVLGLAFQCLKDAAVVNVDYNKLAEVGKFKNAKSANAVFCAVRKKLETASSLKSDITSGSPSASTQANPAIKHETEDADEAVSNEENVADTEQTPTPAKKPRAPRKPKAKPTAPAVKTEAEDDTADPFSATLPNDITTDTTPAKPKRQYNRKPKDPNAPPAKRAKKQAATTTTTTPADAENGTTDHLDSSASIFGGDSSSGVKTGAANNEGEDGDDKTAGVDGATDGLSNLTKSEAEIAAEDTLMPDSV